MQQTDPQLKIRLPRALKRKIDESAAANNRTMSGEIIARLEWSYEAGFDAVAHSKYQDVRSKAAAAKLLRMGPTGDALEKRVADLEARVQKLEKEKHS